jgi:hypothetical protein
VPALWPSQLGEPSSFGRFEINDVVSEFVSEVSDVVEQHRLANAAKAKQHLALLGATDLDPVQRNRRRLENVVSSRQGWRCGTRTRREGVFRWIHGMQPPSC